MEAAVPEDHVLVRIAREIHRDCQAGARIGDLRLLVTSPEFKALPQFQQDVAHTVCGLEERLEWISEFQDCRLETNRRGLFDSNMHT